MPLAYQSIFLILAMIFAFCIARLLAAHPSFFSDIPNQRSGHSEAISRAGGLSFALPALCFFFFYFWESNNAAYQALCIGSFAFCMLGLWDDAYGLSAQVRLVLSLVLACGLCFWASSDSFSINFFNVALLPWFSQFLGEELAHVFLYVICILWVLACVHFFNFMDGMDALAGLQALWIILHLALLLANEMFLEIGAPVFRLQAMLFPYCSLALCLLAFLYWNWPKASVFMGDNGSYFLGFSMSFAALLSWPGPPVQEGQEESTPFAIDLGLLACAWLPFFLDAALTLFLRSTEGKNIFMAHREHLYQRLGARGWSPLQILGLYSLLNVFLLIPLGLAVFYDAFFFSAIAACLLGGLYLGLFLYLRMQKGGISLDR